MLSQAEICERHDFYEGVFGRDRLRNNTLFTRYLWPVSAYSIKIEGLKKRGFRDPQKMITSLPAILGLSFENIDRKLRLCRLLKVDVTAFIAYTHIFIGMSSKHYLPIVRKCLNDRMEPSPKNVFAIYRAKTF